MLAFVGMTGCLSSNSKIKIFLKKRLALLRARLTLKGGKERLRGPKRSRLYKKQGHAPALWLGKGLLCSRLVEPGHRGFACLTHLAPRWWLVSPSHLPPSPNALSSELLLGQSLVKHVVLFNVESVIASAMRHVAHGLGGLRSFKLKYKGKSFKWHKRRKSLLLRFGHSHLVFVPTLAGLR